MADLLKKVNDVLSQELSDFVSGLEKVKATRRVMGLVISPDFENKDHGVRQRLLTRILKKALTTQEMERVGPIVTMTPNEAAIHEEMN